MKISCINTYLCSFMKVFKFGGASVKDAEAVKNVGKILQKFSGDKLLIVISAMGKTTNALERVMNEWYDGKLEEAHRELAEIKNFHNKIIGDLVGGDLQNNYHDVDNLFIELECNIENAPVNKDYNFLYDQIVGYGELISTKIVSIYLQSIKMENRWLDARNFIQTSSDYREAKINWDPTLDLISKKLLPLVNRQLVITQGFIGRNERNNTTTLGREGSDYSASIFAFCLDAESVTIWKDVAGVMNVDPKRMSGAKIMREISFNKAIELAYYGATILHPKTMQPLLRKSIPLYVRSFVDPDEKGSVIRKVDKTKEENITCYIFKDDQILLRLSSKDFSFIVESHLSSIFSMLAQLNIQVNVMQNSAISFSFCATYDERKFATLIPQLKEFFILEIFKDLTLITLHNFKGNELPDILKDKKILIEQHSKNVVQYVYQ
ncbi:MAG: aspartate kinase [Flavobacteriales bacterium]|nr:aspartate kinase [Flavobacteriales bacterium]